jgi:formylglycine-generating enzyme required for sulfatase activity
LVPAGEFLMGSTNADPLAVNDEKPQHRVYVGAFYIDKTEVTVGEYKRFINATGYWEPPNWQDQRSRDNYPVVRVSWHDAQAYAQWAGKQLPTEAEWEKAARGTDGRIYPWGSIWDWEKASVRYPDSHGNPMPVGSYLTGGSPYGCLDMAGNVSEWCVDWYDWNYYAHSPTQNPVGPDSGKERVVRGGSYFDIYELVRCAFRFSYPGQSRLDSVGFRCIVRVK